MPMSDQALAGQPAASLKSSSLRSVHAFALAGVTERTAIASAGLIGRGDEQAADESAVQAMRSALGELDIDGRIVVGGGRDDSPHLFIGEKVGSGRGPQVDIALDPLEGTTLTAKAMANAVTVVAISTRGGFLHAPDVYMDKLAIGPGYPKDLIDLDAPAGENALRLARAKGVGPGEITACVLDRPRHEKIITSLRQAGIRVALISDGDVAGILNTADPETQIDMYVGQGRAPEGVLAAAALKCVGGQMQARIAVRNEPERMRAKRGGVEADGRRLTLDELAPGETIFAATGVTKGSLVDGVRRERGFLHTHTMVMSSFDRVVRKIRTVTPIGR